MQLAQFNPKCTKTASCCSQILSFTAKRCKPTYEAMSRCCQFFTNRIQQVTNASRQMKNDMICLIFQTIERFLEFIEDRLFIECPDNVKHNTKRRALIIFQTIKNQKFAVLVYQFLDFNEEMLKKTKQYAKTCGEKHFLPTYVNLKATFMVSRELLLEIFHEKLRHLQMTYKNHKDTITIYWIGDKTKYIVQNISKNLVNFRQLTINFIQKGIEIRVSKNDLAEKFHMMMGFITQTFNNVAQMSNRSLISTQTKIIELYQSVLGRIREKKLQIKIEMGIIKAKPILERGILDIGQFV